MNVASLELCKELYELSGWSNNAGTKPSDRLSLWQQRYSTWEMGQGNLAYESTPPDKRRGIDIGEWHVTEDTRWMLFAASLREGHWYDSEVQKLVDASIPAYDLGYLLRKLPRYLEDGSGILIGVDGIDDWNTGYFRDDDWTVLVNSKNFWGRKPVVVPPTDDAKLRAAGIGTKETTIWSEEGKHSTLVDTVCKLAIELFKQDFLKKEAS